MKTYCTLEYVFEVMVLQVINANEKSKKDDLPYHEIVLKSSMKGTHVSHKSKGIFRDKTNGKMFPDHDGEESNSS